MRKENRGGKKEERGERKEKTTLCPSPHLSYVTLLSK
jgi:hypothetical protein